MIKGSPLPNPIGGREWGERVEGGQFVCVTDAGMQRVWAAAVLPTHARDAFGPPRLSFS